ncbi:MAG: type II secretion system F family protein [Bacteroidales bacterium]|jgi:type IV pilus assembly protein PilC
MVIDIKEIREKKGSRKRGSKGKGMNFDFLNREISFRKKKISDIKKERFYSQLGVLFSSGIDLGSALQIFNEDKHSQSHKKIFSRVFDDVIGGMSFSEALKKTGQFSNYEYYSIKVGEESGKLHEVLGELADYFALRVQQRRQLTGALSYPVMVMIVAAGAVIFMLNVVVPMFAGVFQRFGGELPGITKKVLALSDWFSDHLFMIFLVIAGFATAIAYLKKHDWFKKYSALFVLRIPFLGRLTSRLMHARFCHSLSLLTLTQVPLLEALEMVKKMIGFYPFQEAIGNIQKEIEKGGQMHVSMSRQNIFEQRLVSLTKVGEEVNQVGQLYARLYKQYTDEVKHLTSVMGNMLEPVMILAVGLMVMVILIAMYLPLFQLSTTVF